MASVAEWRDITGTKAGVAERNAATKTANADDANREARAKRDAADAAVIAATKADGEAFAFAMLDHTKTSNTYGCLTTPERTETAPYSEVQGQTAENERTAVLSRAISLDLARYDGANPDELKGMRRMIKEQPASLPRLPQSAERGASDLPQAKRRQPPTRQSVKHAERPEWRTHA
jgi:hypothetical protein